MVIEVAINTFGLLSALAVGLLLSYYLMHYKSSWVKIPRIVATVLIAVTAIMVPFRPTGASS